MIGGQNICPFLPSLSPGGNENTNAELVRKLRHLHQPALLLGETKSQRLLRLKAAESKIWPTLHIMHYIYIYIYIRQTIGQLVLPSHGGQRVLPSHGAYV